MAKELKASKAKEEWLDEFERQKAEEEEERKKKEEQKKERKRREEEKLKRLRKLEKKLNRENKRKVFRPFKLLWAISILFTLLFVLFILFIRLDLFRSVFFTFWLFISLFFGGGLIMAGIFYLVSVDKEQELRERKIIEELEAEEEAKKREEEEEEELHKIESELETEQNASLPRSQILDNKGARDPEGKLLPPNREGIEKKPINVPVAAQSAKPGAEIPHSIGSSAPTELPDSLTEDDSKFQLTELDIPSGKIHEDDFDFDLSSEDINDSQNKKSKEEINSDTSGKTSEDGEFVERVFG